MDISSENIPSESKFLKGSYASRDEQRWKRPSFRQVQKKAIHDAFTEKIQNVIRQKNTTSVWCDRKRHMKHSWTPEVIIDDEWMPHYIVTVKTCKNCNQIKHRYEPRKELESPDCEA